MPKLEELAVVALLRDLPEHGLVRGQVGTVVQLYPPTAVEVEFCDLEGRTYALVPLPPQDLMPLHYDRLGQAA